MSKTKAEHWAFSALKKRLSEKSQVIESPSVAGESKEPRILRTFIPTDWEYGTVFLFDPELKIVIEDFFKEYLYPAISAVFESEIFEIPALEQIKLKETRKLEASLNALFLMTDPQRPVGTPQRPPWYVRYNLEVKDGRYFLNTELLLSLQFSAASDWILEFLAETGSGWAIPPSLSCDRDEFLLSFEWGQGRGILLANDEWKTHLTTPFIKHIKIAHAIDRFSRQSENYLLRNRMLQIIMDMYGHDD